MNKNTITKTEGNKTTKITNSPNGTITEETIITNNGRQKTIHTTKTSHYDKIKNIGINDAIKQHQNKKVVKRQTIKDTIINDDTVTSHHENYSYTFNDEGGKINKIRRIITHTSNDNYTKKPSIPKIILYIIIGIFIINFISPILSDDDVQTGFKKIFASNDFVILSTIENNDMEDELIEYGKKNKIKIRFEYAEDLDAVSLINNNGEYDAIWASNSLWLYQIETYPIMNSKSISINPVVMAIKKSKAESLGLVGRDVTNKELVDIIKNGQLKYVMSSVVKTNSGATSYLGFLNSLAGSPEVLKSEMLLEESLKKDMVGLFSGVERVSGTSTFLEDMFLNSDEYEAVIAAETSLIRINQQLNILNKEPLYLIYPTDGVAISDSPFAYIDRGQNKEKKFEKIQSYLLSETMQKKLENKGRRTWYGGTNEKANPKIFNKDWGIDTTKYLIPQNYPSKKVITESTNLYIEEFRKPSHTVFLLDYSGSMSGSGNEELENAMNYILNYNEASKDFIQFSNKDKITVIPFTDEVEDIWETSDGKNTENLISNITVKSPGGGTDIYIAALKALEILSPESDNYTKTIILMTDGHSTTYDEYTLSSTYRNNNLNIPIYSIMFGDASNEQLTDIATLTNAKVFDGRSNLLEAFKEVRSFN